MKLKELDKLLTQALATWRRAMVEGDHMNELCALLESGDVADRVIALRNDIGDLHDTKECAASDAKIGNIGDLDVSNLILLGIEEVISAARHDMERLLIAEDNRSGKNGRERQERQKEVDDAQEIDALSDAQVILRVSCHGVGDYHADRALRERLEAIARTLDEADRKCSST